MKTISVLTITTLIAAIYLFNLNYSASTKNKIERITLGIAQESLAALTIIAAEKEFFTDQNVDVTIKLYKGGKQALVNGLLMGQVDLATVADVPIVFSSFKRKDFKIIATIGTSDNEPKIIARHDKNIHTAKDLKGKNIATKKGSAVHYFLSTFLIYNQLTEDEINLSFLKNGTELVSSLINGQIDAFVHREPYISQAKLLLGKNAIIFERPGIYLKTFNLVAKDTAITQKPEAIRRVLKALLIAEKYVSAHPQNSIDIVAQYLGNSSLDLAKIWENLNLKVSLDQLLITTFEVEARWAIREKLIVSSEIPDYFNIIDASLLKAVSPHLINIYAK